MFLFVFGIFVFLCLETDAFAWGPCVHTMFSMGLISNNIFPVPPEVLNLITRFPFEFIYGALSLDFQLKGKNIRHKHGWEDGFDALEKAGSDKERAYAMGFLTHLAADIGAHHFFVPKVFKHHGGERKFRHLMCELRVDRWYARQYSGIAQYAITQGHKLCDEALRGKEIISKGIYDMKKQVYRRGLTINRFVPSLRPFWFVRKRFREEDVMAHRALLISREAILSVLWELRGAWPVKFDPLGPGEEMWDA